MEFLPIRPSTLRGDQKIQFDVYVSVGGRNIIYLRKGDAFDGVRLQRLKEKNLKKLFIRNEDEPSYIKYITDTVSAAYDSKNMPMEQRVEIIHGSQVASAESVMESPDKPSNYEQAKAGAGQYVEFLIKEESAVRAMLSGGGTELDLGQHVVAVSTISAAIGRKLGLKFSDIQLLTLGSLLHDFGHMEAKYPLFAPLDSLSHEVKLTYKRHPADGLEAVQLHQHFDETVVHIIAEHEELIDGSGYPNKFNESQLNPLAMIVATANAFDCMMRFERLSREDTLKKFVRTRAKQHPSDHINALIAT